MSLRTGRGTKTGLTGTSARSASAIPGYAREELVAELGAAFLCATSASRRRVRADHADYLGHWLDVLREDKRAIFTAAAHAQRAADFLQALQEPPAAAT